MSRTADSQSPVGESRQRNFARISESMERETWTRVAYAHPDPLFVRVYVPIIGR